MNRLKEKYQKIVLPTLVSEFKIANTMAVPRIVKVTVNSGIGNLVKNKAELESFTNDLATILGQKPSLRLAKISVASFAVRQGMTVGLRATLRGERMYSFLDRLFSIALPRLRDFRGLSLKSFDQRGNYTLGIEEHTVFPEIDLVKSNPHGFELTIVTNTTDAAQSKRLLELLGMPFEKN